MKKILFVTSRNIVNPSGELRLIKNRANALKNSYGIKTDFIGFVNNKKLKKEREFLDDYCVELVSYKANPFDICRKYKFFLERIREKLSTEEYKAVIISGSFPGNIIGKVKKQKNVYTVYDCHGAKEELLEYNTTLKRKFLYILLTFFEKLNLRNADAVLAVSRELKKYLMHKYSYIKPIFIVPCALSVKKYSIEQIIKFRTNWRKELGIDDDELLFVYSGGNSKWQCIDTSYNIFRKYVDDGGKAKMLILTTKPDEMNYPKAKIMSFPADKVEEVLFAGDVAMFIREDKVTNNVAFPNKYLEYVKSNMFIISTPYIGEISEEIEKENIGMLICDENDFCASMLDDKLKAKQKIEEETLRREQIIEKYKFENTLKEVADKIAGEV